MSDIIHLNNSERKGFYSCNWAVGKGKKEKLSYDINIINCSNCLKRWINFKCICGHTAKQHGYYLQTFYKNCGICDCKLFRMVNKNG